MEESEIKKLIMEELTRAYGLGEGAGGSGHMASIGAKIHDIQQEDKDGSTIVRFKYSIWRESEFTVYDDNDPEPPVYESEIAIRDGKVFSNNSR